MPRERGIRQDDKFNSLARIPTILLVIVSVSFAHWSVGADAVIGQSEERFISLIVEV